MSTVIADRPGVVEKREHPQLIFDRAGNLYGTALGAHLDRTGISTGSGFLTKPSRASLEPKWVIRHYSCRMLLYFGFEPSAATVPRPLA